MRRLTKNMFFSPMPRIAVTEITDDIHCVGITITKIMMVMIGRPARNVGNLSRRKCTFGMAQMSTILRN